MTTTKGTPAWIQHAIGVAATVAASWYALGEKMESVVDARVSIAEARLREHVEHVADERIAPFTAAVYAQLDSLKAELAAQVSTVGEGIATAVRTGNRPVLLAPDTTGEAALRAQLDDIEQLLRDVRTLQLLQKLPGDREPSNGSDDVKKKKR